MKLYAHQSEALEETENLTHVAFYHDMGLGKTFTGAEKMHRLGAWFNLVICQKSKVRDWIEHFEDNYPDWVVFDGTKTEELESFVTTAPKGRRRVCVINYDLVWRRGGLLLGVNNFTLLLDESSLIQNEKAKRSKFILKMEPRNVILLSGTPTGGKYERLWSQLHLLGWNISREMYWRQYVQVEYLDLAGNRSIPVVKGYRNVDRLKRKMHQHGCRFLKSDEVFDMPKQTFVKCHVNTTPVYRQFRKNRIVEFAGKELVGDTTLTRMLYERQLCGVHNAEKLKAFRDLVESTDDRLVVFYNFTDEMDAMRDICEGELKRDTSLVNGTMKNLVAYETISNSITFVQYQAGAMGLNLQKANKVIYFSLPLSSELFEQSKKRIHRIGQEKPCFYYMLICRRSIEERILKALEMRQDYTEKLFEKGVSE